MDRSRFPDHFLFGAATSAYQIEGSPLADGAGHEHLAPLLPHPRPHLPDGETGDVACDHYRRWSADVDLMADLGLQCLPLQPGLGRGSCRRAAAG